MNTQHNFDEQAYKGSFTSRKNDPFKKDTDNDPTRKPVTKETEKNDPGTIDPAIPEEENNFPPEKEADGIVPSIPEHKPYRH